jgi:hypothetical protein
MNSCGTFCSASFLLLIVTAGCGGGGKGVDSNNVTVNVAPASVTVSASGQVTLQATVKGTSNDATAAVTWSIDEQKTDGASGAQCVWLDTPPDGPCPDGTIEQTTAGNFLTVTYHAPSTSGTFHVTAEWSTLFDPVIIKDGTSVITVSP